VIGCIINSWVLIEEKFDHQDRVVYMLYMYIYVFSLSDIKRHYYVCCYLY